MINVTFSRYVKMNGRLWEVNFRKLSRGNNLFYADTATLQGERIAFEVDGDHGPWKVTGKNVPQWIVEYEQNIGAAIEQGLKERFPQLVASESVA